jgi:F0F1-type ATP synthase epsilon subunit
MTDKYPVVHSNEKLKVVVKSPEGIVFDGEVFAITSKNIGGLFDVLPYHSNFISIIKELLLLYETKDSPKEMKIENGVMKVSENDVEIFLGVETIT